MMFLKKSLLICSLSAVWCCTTVLSDIAATKTLENWIPSDQFSNSTSINWFSRKIDQDVKNIKSTYGRNFQDADLETVNRAFNEFNNYNNEFDEKDDYKAIPFQVNDQAVSPNAVNAPFHLHTTLFPQHSSSNIPKPFYTAAQASSYPNAGAAFVSQPLSYTTTYQSFQAPSQNLENFDSYLPPSSHHSQFTDNTTNVELNTRHLLYLQPGKCSNSIEIGRIRDLEIKSTFKYGNDNQKAVCILMLYAVNENNKLAISMQSVQETPSAELATESWLQRNVKIYSLQAGTVAQTPIELV